MPGETALPRVVSLLRCSVLLLRIRTRFVGFISDSTVGQNSRRVSRSPCSFVCVRVRLFCVYVVTCV